jgi:hypothetical protein
MTSIQRADFGKSLALLAVSLGFELDEPTIGVYWHTLRAIQPEIRREAFGQAAEQPWRRLPQPGELRALCAKVSRGKREAAARVFLADCPHSGHWVDTPDGVQRCSCWTQAMHAMETVGQAIALPTRAGDDE